MASDDGAAPLQLFRWSSRAIVGVTLVAMAAGFGQFGAVAALGDVAKAFGHQVSGLTVTDQAGLSGTQLGLGLSVLRLASLAALPLTFLADRTSRRKVMLWSAAGGLSATVIAATTGGYWWFVAVFALGRPLLSATSAIGQVIVAEETSSANRARAIALVTAGYGIGSGLTALLHGAAEGALGFRGLFVLAAVPLLAMPLLARMVVEPGRFVRYQAEAALRPSLGRVQRTHRRRLLLVASLAFGVALTSGPATGFVYLDAEDVARLPGWLISVMVLAAGLLGLFGLLLGRYSADRYGRRPTGIVAMAGIALVSILTYSGPHWSLVLGYCVGVCFASLLAPTAGSFVNELFPTEVRGQVAGWLVVASVLGAVVGLLVFGAIADAGGTFADAALGTFPPTALIGLLFLALPETRGTELESLEEHPGPDGSGQLTREWQT